MTLLVTVYSQDSNQDNQNLPKPLITVEVFQTRYFILDICATFFPSLSLTRHLIILNEVDWITRFKKVHYNAQIEKVELYK